MQRIIALVSSILAIISIAPTFAATPPLISYQGKLMQPSGAPVPDGTYSVRFAVYDAAVDGNSLWSEVNSNVLVKGGLFAVVIGSQTNLPTNIFDEPERWFAIKIGNDPEMMPRQQIASAPFAFKAATAGTVDDNAIVTSKIADAAVTAAKLASGVAIPPGGIIMWSGAATAVPTGWALCDGQNGTPDLRDRFIVGAGSGDAVGATGGISSVTLAVGQMPRHSHIGNTSSDGMHQHPANFGPIRTPISV